MKELDIPLVEGYCLKDLVEREAGHWRWKLQLLRGPGLLPRAIAAEIYGPEVYLANDQWGDPRPKDVHRYVPRSVWGHSMADFDLLRSWEAWDLHDADADTLVNAPCLQLFARQGNNGAGKWWAWDALDSRGLSEGIREPRKIDKRSRGARFKFVREVDRIRSERGGTDHAAVIEAASELEWDEEKAKTAWGRAVKLAKHDALLHYVVKGEPTRWKVTTVLTPDFS